jgi:ectoine hydroxylase-related dioxygenase (phytanoyl-CoA dioxygenase family)
VSVWVALVDCVVENGAMSMLDGSHRSLRSRRGMWAYQAFGGIEDSMQDLLTPVVVRAGEAVILDDAVVHYSPPNLTSRRRLAIQFVMVPDEADAIFHQQVGGDGSTMDVDVWSVTPEFFFDFWHGDGDAAHRRLIERIRMPVPNFDLATLQELVRTSPGG